MGAHDFKLNKVPFPALKPVNIMVSRSAAPKQALLPASRYNCDVKESNLKVWAKFHKDLKRFRWVPMTSNLTRCFFFLEKQ